MKKRSIILILCLVFIAFLAGGFYYINKVLLPSVVRQKIVQGLSDFTASKVTLGGLRLNLLKGLVLKDLVIYDKDTPQQRLAEIKELSAGFLILPSFKEKKIIIPSLSVREATLTIGRRKDGTLTIAYLLEKIKPKKTDTTASMPSVIVRQVNLKDSAILWTDETIEPAATARLRLKQAEARLGFNKAILSASTEIIRGDATTYISIDADYAYGTKNLSGRIVLRDLDMARYLDYLPGAPYAPTQGFVDTLEASFTLQEQKTFSSQIQLRSKKINAVYQDIAVSDAEINANFSFSVPTDNWSAWQGKGQLDVVQAALRSTAPLQAEARMTGAHADITCGQAVIGIISDFTVADLRGQSGDIKAAGINASVHAQIDIPRPDTTDVKNIPLKYKGSLDVTSGTLSGLPYVGQIKIASLQASFEEKNISLTQMSAEVLGTTITASGSLKDNALNLKASGKIGLQTLLPVIKEYYGGPVTELSGEADATIHILADLAHKKTSFEGDILLQEPVIVLDAASPLKASGGRVSFNTQEERIAWHLEGLSLLGRAFDLDGTWKGFQTSSCVVKAAAQDMMLEAHINKTNNALDIPSLKISVKDSQLEGSGQYDLATAAFHLNAGGDINITDLKEWVPQKAVFEKPVDLNGLCHIQLNAAGPAKEWTSWKINSNITSKAVHVKGFTIKDIALNYTQTAGQGLINFLNFTAYNGPAVIKGRLILNTPRPRYSVTGEIKDLDLNLLKNDIPDLKGKTFYGKLSLQAVADGAGTDPKSISGQGQIVVTDGNIWEFNPLKGLGSFIFMPRFDTLSFSHATGDFSIKDGWLMTENLDLMGQDVELLVKGRIGFDGTLDLMAVTQVPTTGPGQSPIGDVINTAGGMTAINITGNIQKPQYKLQPITKNIFNKIQDFLSNIAP
ncbi:hypothetical protein BU251_01645 [Candidatus Velamenicoccus archaeovorus]|uniref:Uncharacterized protein n=1 Tax=Velamenicoccus archaeovorus TaxID=1930593 RepID=A0A410P345_VELA1|nr:AsmA-like C-terminal region-containing protein [Candidatus Velamenicoccus archaeovorus]QAT16521.1 hypothetical protein BU251_01645 [Candidatus Velamenicoccus archaeovorus]